jgi:hypothetical protein
LIKDRDALLTFYDFPAEPSAISGGAGLEHPSGSVTRPGGAILFLVGGLPLRYALSVSSLKFVRYGADAVRYTPMPTTN